MQEPSRCSCHVLLSEIRITQDLYDTVMHISESLENRDVMSYKVLSFLHNTYNKAATKLNQKYSTNLEIQSNYLDKSRYNNPIGISLLLANLRLSFSKLEDECLSVLGVLYDKVIRDFSE